MKITRRQLRHIIKEAIDPRELEEPIGGYAGDALTGDPDYAYPPMADYQGWVEENGHITPAASSVMASYVIAKGIDYDVMEQLARELRVDPTDVEQDILRQLGERG
jgi:hypothetical protein